MADQEKRLEWRKEGKGSKKPSMEAPTPLRKERTSRKEGGLKTKKALLTMIFNDCACTTLDSEDARDLEDDI
jgi:hypothetical protein